MIDGYFFQNTGTLWPIHRLDDAVGSLQSLEFVLVVDVLFFDLRFGSHLALHTENLLKEVQLARQVIRVKVCLRRSSWSFAPALAFDDLAFFLHFDHQVANATGRDQTVASSNPP